MRAGQATADSVSRGAANIAQNALASGCPVFRRCRAVLVRFWGVILNVMWIGKRFKPPSRAPAYVVNARDFKTASMPYFEIIMFRRCGSDRVAPGFADPRRDEYVLGTWAPDVPRFVPFLI